MNSALVVLVRFFQKLKSRSIKGEKIMRKSISAICCATALMMFLGFGNAFAATSKSTCGAGDLSEVEFNSAAPIFTQTIHSASQKDLFVDVSLECGLTTNTKVMSKALQRAISEAEAYVKVWVEIDPEYDDDGRLVYPDLDDKGNPINDENLAEPGVVTFARRYQGLIADFAGYVDETCYSVDTETGNVTIAEDCVEDEMVALILDTMTANSFNFIFADLEAGDHDVVVWANVDYNMAGTQYTDEDLSAFAPEDISTRAYLGKGSVTVESVRLVKDEAIEIQ